MFMSNSGLGTTLLDDAGLSARAIADQLGQPGRRSPRMYTWVARSLRPRRQACWSSSVELSFEVSGGSARERQHFGDRAAKVRHEAGVCGHLDAGSRRALW